MPNFDPITTLASSTRNIIMGKASNVLEESLVVSVAIS